MTGGVELLFGLLFMIAHSTSAHFLMAYAFLNKFYCNIINDNNLSIYSNNLF